MVVEVKESSRSESYNGILRADSLFWAKRWKAFLLGYEKYGPKNCWDPVKPLRGRPENHSPLLEGIFERRSENQVEDMEKSMTWYTLEELKGIDLEEDVGVPDDPDNWTDYKYTVDTFIHGVERDPKVPYAWFHSETIQQALEEGGEIDIEVTEDDELPVDQREKQGKQVSETRSATLEVRKRKRKDYATNFQKLINLMEDFRTEDSYDRLERISDDGGFYRPSDEEIRLVVWQLC